MDYILTKQTDNLCSLTKRTHEVVPLTEHNKTKQGTTGDKMHKLCSLLFLVSMLDLTLAQNINCMVIPVVGRCGGGISRRTIWYYEPAIKKCGLQTGCFGDGNNVFVSETLCIFTCVQINIGPAGPPGVKGFPGADGLNGPKGFMGDAGLQGLDGPKGDPGLPTVGIRGPKGEKGANAMTADTGLRGPEGPRGNRGDVGITGSKGTPGAVGPPGPVGARGEPGEPGPPGPPGPPGERIET